jgi:hypothetical protein
LNGYLTKPTTRLGRYTLLFKEILKHTPPDHPDQHNLTKAIEIIKQLLSNVNLEAGHAKNAFDLMRIDQNLTFKLKSDQVVKSKRYYSNSRIHFFLYIYRILIC